MFDSVGRVRQLVHTSCEHFIHTIFSHAHVSPRKTGVAGRNPLTAPARALPAGHITLAEALLSGLDHPWPHRERPATTRDTGTAAKSDRSILYVSYDKHRAVRVEVRIDCVIDSFMSRESNPNQVSDERCLRHTMLSHTMSLTYTVK